MRCKNGFIQHPPKSGNCIPKNEKTKKNNVKNNVKNVKNVTKKLSLISLNGIKPQSPPISTHPEIISLARMLKTTQNKYDQYIEELHRENKITLKGNIKKQFKNEYSKQFKAIWNPYKEELKRTRLNFHIPAKDMPGILGNVDI
jgi:hypothetical protein